MLFAQRRRPGFLERIRLWAWPRVSFRRSGRYYFTRTMRLSGTPHAVALGAALGAGVACTPLLGFHLLITAALAWLLGGSIVAGAIGSCIGNPITFPILWAGSYELGKAMLGEAGQHAPQRLEHDLVHKSWSELGPVLEPMVLGAAPIGAAVGLAVYFVVYRSVAAYQANRRERLAAHQKQQAQTFKPPLLAEVDP